MKHLAIYLAIIVASVAVVRADGPATRPSKIIKLTVTPAAQPSPALKYQFLPDVMDQTPQDAAPLYREIEKNFKVKDWEIIDKWLKMRLDKLPRKKVSACIKRHSAALQKLYKAARCEKCDWGFEAKVRKEGFNVLLPSLNTYRSLAKVLALQARLQIADGQYEKAIHSLQNGFAMGRHISTAPCLIHDLVSASICALMVERVKDLAQGPDSPNLYWALAQLPKPMIDIRPAMRYELSMARFGFPGLWEMADGKIKPKQWEKIVKTLQSGMCVEDQDKEDPKEDLKEAFRLKLRATAMMMTLYPKAKKYLISQGRTKKQVEAMPIQQVAAIYSIETWRQVRDEILKWYNLPYWKARKGLARLGDLQIRAYQKGVWLTALMPSLSRAYILTTRPDLEIAVLQCIESVRMYAADHDGKLPAKLSDIIKAPTPINPMTGKQFIYKPTGNTFILDALDLSINEPAKIIRYEVTVKSR